MLTCKPTTLAWVLLAGYVQASSVPIVMLTVSKCSWCSRVQVNTADSRVYQIGDRLPPF